MYVHENLNVSFSVSLQAFFLLSASVSVCPPPSSILFSDVDVMPCDWDVSSRTALP